MHDDNLDNDGNISRSNSSSSRRRVTQEEYVIQLQEKNRMKKQMEAKSRGEKQVEERERGFQTHFGGANKDGVVKNTSGNSSLPRTNSAKKVVKPEGRKGWAAGPPQFILGADGPVQLKQHGGVVRGERTTSSGSGTAQRPSSDGEVEEEFPDDFQDDVVGEEEGEEGNDIPQVLAHNSHSPSTSVHYDEDEIEETDELSSVVSSSNALAPTPIPASSTPPDERDRDRGITVVAAVMEGVSCASPGDLALLRVSLEDSLSRRNPTVTTTSNSLSHTADTAGNIEPQRTHTVGRVQRPMVRPSSQQGGSRPTTAMSLQYDDTAVSGPPTADELAEAMDRENAELRGKTERREVKQDTVPRKSTVSNNSRKSVTKQSSSCSDDDEQSEAASASAAVALSTAESLTSAQNIPVSDLLLQKLASLDVNQQEMLLNMLHKLDSKPTDTSTTNSSTSAMRKSSAPPPEKFNGDNAGLQLSSTKPGFKGDSDVPVSSVVAPSDSKKNDGEDIAVNIRIRIHSTWGKMKTASLARVRLRHVASDQDVDLTSFQTKVLAGMLPLPQTSEAVRRVSSLFARPVSTRRHLRAEGDAWKGPVDPGTHLEISLQGSIRKNETEDKPVGDVTDNLELWLWNGDTARMGKSVTESIASKDVDVFLGSQCVWSGQLTQPPPSNSADYMFGSAAEAEPSVKISFAKGVDKKTKAMPSKDEAAVVIPKIDTSTASLPSGATTKDPVATDTEDKVVPIWFSGIKPSAVIDDPSPLLSDRSTSSRSASGRRRQPVATPDGDTKPEEKTSANFAVADKGGGLGRDRKPPRPVSQEISPRPGLADSDSRSSVISASPNEFTTSRQPMIPSSVMTSSSAIEESEDILYTEKAILKKPPRRGGPPSVENGDGIDPKVAKPIARDFSMRTSGPSATSKSEDANLSKNLEAIRHSDRLNRGRLSTVGGGNSNSVENKRENRARRIEEVQGTVESALANLADVMSTITPHRKQQQPPPPQPAADSPSPFSAIFGSKLSRQSPYEDSDKIFHSFAGKPAPPPTIREDERETDNIQEFPTKHNIAMSNDEFESIDALLSCTADLTDVLGVSQNPPADLFLSTIETSLCQIPVLPKGKTIRLDVLSTWGDPFYVGLNGIELFDASGEALSLGSGISQITADPDDINVLPEYVDDPRVVGNLLNGINFTKDDLHVWLAPNGVMGTSYDEELVAVITIELEVETQLSMIRVWNYNKSRTHCYRGVRRCRIKFDGADVFDGEIRIAPGVLDSAESCSEVILFTLDSAVLASVAKYDEEKGSSHFHPFWICYLVKDATPQWLNDAKKDWATVRDRPDTAEGFDPQQLVRRTRAPVPALSYHDVAGNSDIRPTTSALRPESREDISRTHVSASLSAPLLSSGSKPVERELKNQSRLTDHSPNLSSDSPTPSYNFGILSEKDLCYCREVGMLIETTWGDKSYVGLTGIDVLLGASCLPVPDLDEKCLKADPWDMSSVGCYDDYRTPDKLIDGVNDTTDDKHMWLIPYTAKATHSLKIDLGASCKVAGIRVWNYNKCQEDTLRGAKRVLVVLDGKPLGRVVFRIAPGCDGVEFGQTILFRDISRQPQGVDDNTYLVEPGKPFLRYISPAVRQDYEVPTLPSALLWKFTIFTNWSDKYYVGLDGIEMFSSSGEKLNVLSRGRVGAVPFSLRDISGCAQDARVPENLFNETNNDPTGRNSWLAPLSVCMTKMERENSGLRVMRKQKGYRKIKDKYEKSGGSGSSKSVVSVGYGGYGVEDVEAAVEEEELYLFYPHNDIYVLFDKPTAISHIRLFNYSKNVKRGVRDFALEADGELVYMGSLLPADREKDVFGGGQSILFTNDNKVVRNEKEKVHYCGQTEQDVLCINERQVMVRSKDMYEQPNSTTAGIHSDLGNRPVTAIVREEEVPHYWKEACDCFKYISCEGNNMKTPTLGAFDDSRHIPGFFKLPEEFDKIQTTHS
eukprot:gene1688-3265_t